MKRATLAIAAVVALACMVGTAAAAGGTPASLAANVASATVTHYPYGPYVGWRVPGPIYRRPLLVGPAFVPPPVVITRPVFVGPRFRPIMGGSVIVESPFVSVGVGY